MKHHSRKDESLTEKIIRIKTSFFLVFVQTLSVSSLKAQFDKGQKLLGGNVGFSTSKTNNGNNFSTTATGFGISTGYSIFKKTNQLVGIGLSYNYSQQKNSTSIGTNESTNNANSIWINAFTQKFFLLSSKFFFTVKGNTGFGYVFSKQYNYNGTDKLEDNSKGYTVGLDLAPGFSYKVTPRILCDVSLNSVINLNFAHKEATYSSNGNGSSTNQNTFNINSALNNTIFNKIGIGFRWFLKK